MMRHGEVVCEFLDEILRKNIKGDIAELGVRDCQTTEKMAITILKYDVNKTLYGFDTFEGLPYDEIFCNTTLKKGEFNTNYKSDVERMSKYPFIKLVKGLVEETIVNYNNKFCFAFFDLDLYQSTEIAFNYLKNKITKEGYIIFHDYTCNDNERINYFCNNNINKKVFATIYKNTNIEERLIVYKKL